MAAGHRAARLREVHAPGRHPVRTGLHRGRAGAQRRHHPRSGRAVRGALRPGRNGDIAAGGEARRAKTTEIEERINRALDDVASLDHDRILRSYLTVIRATLRTNYFQPDAEGLHKSYISLKLKPDAIPDLPEPRPQFEIFVYSPRVEGVHLRFGAVARGGLRWSDRRDDFRTEVLGLVKAQMVKNTVIVPVGAKGGFFCKQLPDPGDREAWMAEGIACYRTFISGLLDITDNLRGDESVPPRRVVRHDGDDSYLVVAADKGTATFSDIANGVAKDYGFWLGDAFASGGSVGYDHKAMGITARGAWESVRRHFRERGIDCQTEEFTCVGVGDMSGDVFGNGMLLSPATRLVAAFDHRHIFLDPAPVAGPSYAERQRLFALPRSSWQDYDTSLISEGGGVWARSLKSIPVSAQVRAALGLDASVQAMTPAELMRAILLAPVDLLWNGGIGTYVKAETETHAEVGDKANDAIRVDGHELRCHCVGEGGNLGLTQRGRIEYARRGIGGAGGRINTDFIDNSAGVDTSDHEVNIKILLDQVVANGDLTEKQRNDFLASMTDEVGELVLRDNYEQNHALANAAVQAPQLLHVHEDWIRRLERQGLLDRALEALPSRKTVSDRLERKEGLSAPELSVLLAYTKIVLARDLIDTDIADDPFLRTDLYSYFPKAMRQTYRDRMESHPLRREIIVTSVVNDLVNGAGMTFFHRLSEETAASASELVRANFVAREIFGSRATDRRDRLLRQRHRRGRADPDAAGDAHPGGAGLAVADQQPAPADGQRGDRRVLRRGRPEGRLRAARAAHRTGVRGVHGAAGGAGVPRRARGARREGRGAAAGVHRAEHRGDLPSRRASTRSRWPGCTSRSASGSVSRRWWRGSWRFRARTGGRRWPGPRSATTCTPCMRS